MSRALDHRALLVAISRLRRFTGADVAAHSGQPSSAVEAFLGACEFVEPIRPDGEIASVGTLWRVIPSRADELISRVSRPVQYQSEANRSEGENLNIHQMLGLTLDFIQEKGISPDERRRELDMAHLYMKGVITDLWDRQIESDQSLRSCEAGVMALRERLAALEPSPGEPSTVPIETGTQRQLRQALFDWSCPVPTRLVATDREAALPHPSASPTEIAGTLMKGVLSAKYDDTAALFLPALRAIALRGHVDAEIWPTVRSAVLDSAERLLRLPQPARMLAPISMLAVVLDAPECADVILKVLLDPAAEASLDAASRRLCLAALARLGKTAASGRGHNRAASACLFLVSRYRSQEDLPLLVPAALCIDEADIRMLIQRVADVMFDENGLNEKFRPMLDEGAFIRTLASALFLRQAFANIGNHIQTILLGPKGRALFSTLVAPDHDAVRLREGHESSFSLRPAESVRKIVDPAEGVHIRIAAESDEAKLLFGLVESRGWTPSGPSPLTSLLHRKARPLRLPMELQ